MRLRPLALIVPALALPLLAGDRNMKDVPLDWRPTSTLAESLGALNLLPFEKAKIWVRPFTDTRADKALIGENQEKAEPRTVSTKDDAAAFLTQHTVALFKEAGLPMAASEGDATIVVSADVAAFKVVEKDTYKGQLNLVMEVHSRGKLVWKGSTLGEASRWGRSYKLENYYEALSDSLVDAVSKALKSQPFLDGLAGKAAK